MSTLTDKVQALLTYANGITEKNDTTLGDAVKSLGDGFGGSIIEHTGILTLDTDSTTTTISVPNATRILSAEIFCEELVTNGIGNAICLYSANLSNDTNNNINALMRSWSSTGSSLSVIVASAETNGNSVTFKNNTAKKLKAGYQYKYLIIAL